MNNGQKTAAFLDSLSKEMKGETLQAVARNYNMSPEEAYKEVVSDDAENLLDYMLEPDRKSTYLLMRAFDK